MDICQTTNVIRTKESSIQFLQERNILRSVSENHRVSRGDGIVWRCSQRHQGALRCNKYVW
jgi:hypothetical protein